MYKFFTGTLLLVMTAFCSQAQTAQATIKAGTQPNSVMLSIKPSSTLTNAKLTSLYFAVAIPATILPKPTVTIKNNLNTFITYVVESPTGTEMVGGVPHYVYNFAGSGAVAAGSEKTYNAGVDNDMLEVSFGGGPLGLYVIKTVSLPDGGATLNSYFNIYNLGIDITNTAAMFYGSAPVNSAAGYSGTSFTTVANITLPTKFLSFFATKSDNSAKLTWTVDNEEDNQYFEVEGSTDGRTFTTIQRVNALRNGRSSNTYNTTDLNIARYSTAIVYYRIKQVEASGRIIYSDVRQLSLNSKNLTVSLYPNPVKTVTKLVIDAPEAGKATAIVRDATGKTVKQFTLQLVKGINQQQLDATLFPAGDYNVTIVGENLNQTVKMTKAN